jgi:hypothetical protein
VPVARHSAAEAGSPSALASMARRVLDDHWRSPGYAVPHVDTYPHQWLWDSCFHAIVWAQLGVPDRAVDELRSALAHQGPDGFVPHMTYWSSPADSVGFWGRPATSCLTQPPMYGHALAVLHRAGVALPASLVDAAHAGLAFLLTARRAGGAGGVRIVHPWESGCDDSPRWDAWCPSAAWDLATWRETKSQLVHDLVAALAASDNAAGAPTGEVASVPSGPTENRAFAVESAGFNALVAFNARELASIGHDPASDERLRQAADELAAVLATRWDDRRETWVDVCADGSPGSSARTADSLLPSLVVADRRQAAVALASLIDPAAHGGPFGPAGVHRQEPSFDPHRYWRGPVWPQIAYLLWLASRDAGHDEVADALVAGTAAGAMASGWSEHWHPDTGATQGAAPQSWTGVVAVMAAAT